MAKTKIESAYAKINLFLDVIGRRADGYHLIDGIMQTVSLADRVTVTFEPSSEITVALTVTENDRVPTDMSNLACRAAARYLERAGIGGKISIDLEKKIPMAGGLAGGSADAAAVLRALDSISGTSLGTEELCRIGAKIGADVPFCVRGGAMRTEGIGEILTPCREIADCFLVVACAGDGVSTPWAYGRLDELYNGFSEDRNCAKKVEKLIDALQIRDLSAACLHFENVFESVVSEVNPYVDRIKTILTDSGAVRAMMSGSGPSVFGVFERESDARKACEKLMAENITGHFCKPIGQENLAR